LAPRNARERIGHTAPLEHSERTPRSIRVPECRSCRRPVANDRRRQRQQPADEPGCQAKHGLMARIPGKAVPVADPGRQQTEGDHAHQREERPGDARRVGMDDGPRECPSHVGDEDLLARELAVEVALELADRSWQVALGNPEMWLDRAGSWAEYAVPTGKAPAFS